MAGDGRGIWEKRQSGKSGKRQERTAGMKRGMKKHE